MTMETMNDSSTGITATDGGAAGECPFHNVAWTTLVPGQIMWVALSAILAVAASYLWIYHWSRKTQPRPGPKVWPLVGCIPLLLKYWERYYDYLLEFFDAGHDVVWLCLSSGEAIYVADPKLVEYILKTNFANYPKGHLITKHSEELFGRGIFNSDDEAWSLQRKVASHEFASSVLRDLSTVVYKDHAVTLLRIISDFAQSNQCMDFQDLFMRMTLDSTAKLGFGVELGCLSTSLPAVPFATAFDRVNELSYRRYIDPFWKLKRILGILEEKELNDCVKVLDAFSFDVIRKRREEISMQASEVQEVKTKPDLLSRFMSLKAGNNEGYYSDQALRDVILNFIIAGRDTTGLTLSWFMYQLCLHPEVEEKILEEIQMLEQEESSPKEEESDDQYTRFAELLTYRTLGKLQYLHAALTETLRLYPAVPLDGKTAVADDVLPDGTQVKKGNMVSYAAYPMGRLERVWGPDAKQFRPERWLKNGIFQPESPFKFTSFHAGPRTCLGKDSAYLQMKMTAALLLRFFKFELVPDHEVTYRIMFVLLMKKGVKVTASSR